MSLFGLGSRKNIQKLLSSTLSMCVLMFPLHVWVPESPAERRCPAQHQHEQCPTSGRRDMVGCYCLSARSMAASVFPKKHQCDTCVFYMKPQSAINPSTHTQSGEAASVPDSRRQRKPLCQEHSCRGAVSFTLRQWRTTQRAVTPWRIWGHRNGRITGQNQDPAAIYTQFRLMLKPSAGTNTETFEIKTGGQKMTAIKSWNRLANQNWWMRWQIESRVTFGVFESLYLSFLSQWNQSVEQSQAMK